MSDPVSAVEGRHHDGEVNVRGDGARGMITLRGDLGDGRVQSVCAELTGVDFPKANHANSVGQKGLAWMAPDEVLILVPYAEVGAALDRIAGALDGLHHLAVDVSDARAVMLVQGPFAREVIAKLAPVDLHPDAFRPGQFRRTRLGQVAAAFWMRDAQTFEVICFRSVGRYCFDLLAASAAGGPVGMFPADG